MTAMDSLYPQRKAIVCIDSYYKGIPEGRIFIPGVESAYFESLSQFLIQMDALLDERQYPQPYTQTRRFAPAPELMGHRITPLQIRRGARATFELQVIFRQHTSWQGVLYWQEGKQEQRFRSVLELVILMDSALRQEEGRDVL